jgi:hypothetical protein
MDEAERTEVRAEFGRVANMARAELERWLETEASRSAGWIHEGEKVSVGHQEGRRIVAIKRKKAAELGDDGLARMRKVTGYCHRHPAQRPSGDVTGA